MLLFLSEDEPSSVGAKAGWRFAPFLLQARFLSSNLLLPSVASMIALIGSRTFPNEELIYSTLDTLFPSAPNISFISGGADGTDTICKKWSDSRGYICKVDKVRENEHPFDRNTRVAQVATRIVAFVQRNKFRSGTWNTISQFRKMGKTDYIVYDENGNTWDRY